MAAVRSFFGWLLGTLGVGVLLWLLLARSVEYDDYLALVRSGFLLLGLAGVAWGLLWQRSHMVGVGAALLALGCATFFFEASWWEEHGEPWWLPWWFYDPGWHLGWWFWSPIWPIGLCVGHVALAAFVIVNGLLLKRGARLGEFLGANLILAACVFLLGATAF